MSFVTYPTLACGSAFDRSLSDQQNEVEQFKLAYMAISGSRLDEKEAQRMMVTIRVIFKF
jgi:hypothetical protein